MPVGEARGPVRTKLDEVLERPLDKQAAEEYDRERWGLSPEAVAASEELDEDIFAESR